jgi:hypothetical protein
VDPDEGEGAMPANAAKQDTRPKKKITEITQLGLKAYSLAATYTVELTPRLAAGLLTTLQSNLTSLGVVVPAAIEAKGGAKQATAAQGTALEAAYQSVTAVRLAVGRMMPTADVRKAYGVGTKTSPKVVKDVVAALQTIVDRATANPAEALTFGILPADVTAYTAQIAALKAADQAQEAARAGAPLATKERNSTARQILAAVDSIVGAGVLQFANNPTVRANFEALVHK